MGFYGDHMGFYGDHVGFDESLWDYMVIIWDFMVIIWDFMVLIGIHGELCSDFMWICHGELTKNTGIYTGI